jgi:G:T-mismatch repair DNA endonuclease (very short patch repair protein)
MEHTKIIAEIGINKIKPISAMILRYDESTLGTKGKYKDLPISTTKLYVKCDKCNDVEWSTTWTYRKNRDYDYCQSCKNILGISGMKGKSHSFETIEKFKDGRRSGDNNPACLPGVGDKISKALIGRDTPWLTGKKRPVHSALMKIKMKEVWANYSDDKLKERHTHLMKIGRPGRISKLHLNFKSKLEEYGILGFNTESYIKDLHISVDELNEDKKIIIEIFGNYWHANPKMYESTDEFNFNSVLTASEIWDNDKSRVSNLEDLGYNVIVVWESDIIDDIDKVIKNIKKHYGKD